MTGTVEWLFGYGSLAAENIPADGSRTDSRWCDVAGYRRAWNVAARNTDRLNDSRYYADPATGDRPDILVVFSNLRPAPTDTCDGVAIAVDADALARFDRRELNYRRVDITASVRTPLPGRVWTYVGLDEARRRFESSTGDDRLVIESGYVERIEAAFAAAGPARFERYLASTDPIPCPRRDLRLVHAPEIPPG